MHGAIGYTLEHDPGLWLTKTRARRRRGARRATTAIGYDPALWARLVDQIWAAALSIPEEPDGAGATRVETHLVCEELGRRLTPSPMLG
ncbi:MULTISPECIES: hypothetical protein [Dietzia]|jgi:alkylation response protein AidB-like acyl-CoA dehydrogenase|uniref:Uncharacterized protein n=1 Tax=Dietzia maris TaxID=37915 RepID=A0ABT8GX90_9ACTN|nr:MULTISPECIES: hypothetical protein [Dietzia]ODQ83754.1 hypothetical protein BFG51_08960 [Dietzia alimentaria]MCZ4541833.1 hypothetical protein [Dietzia maris]MCZ4657683.1 hypothetical protein [Dietzia kunjamensis]MDN4504829.1 hypothetical protein [Dietzia maris]MDV3356396.1 hypothetical protein [Dietzia sp. IN118]